HGSGNPECVRRQCSGVLANGPDRHSAHRAASDYSHGPTPRESPQAQIAGVRHSGQTQNWGHSGWLLCPATCETCWNQPFQRSAIWVESTMTSAKPQFVSLATNYCSTMTILIQARKFSTEPPETTTISESHSGNLKTSNSDSTPVPPIAM